MLVQTWVVGNNQTNQGEVRILDGVHVHGMVARQGSTL